MPVSAQTVSTSEIYNSNKYYYGEGEGVTFEEADNLALSSLLTMIGSQITSKTESGNHRKEEKGKLVSDNVYFKATVSTYSQATLTDVQRIVQRDKPPYRILRYISRQDVEEIFEHRRGKIAELLICAENALDQGKIDCALRDYYWAYALVRTMKNPSAETFEGHNLSTWIPNQIEDIIGNIGISAVRRDELSADLWFTYQNKPVSSLEFVYNDHGYETYYKAKDGIGQIELTSESDPDQFNISIVYSFKGCDGIDPEIASVLKVVPDVSVSGNFFNVRYNGLQAIEQATPAPGAYVADLMERASFSQIADLEANKPKEIAETSEYERKLEAIVDAIQHKGYQVDPALFTTRGLDQFRRLMRYGNAKVIGAPQFHFTQFDDYVTAKGLQVAFSFRNATYKKFTENIVFTFDSDGKVCNVAFGLEKTVEDNILGWKRVPENIRMSLVSFIERYQTAYALKDIDYIKQIFDDYAIIITVKENKVVRRTDTGYQTETTYTERRFTKESFLAHLQRGFDSKEFINIRFNDVYVERPDGPYEVYGVQLNQDYYSSNYSDRGYLMLGINYTDPANPTIFVRTWQKEPDPNFGLYSLKIFQPTTE